MRRAIVAWMAVLALVGGCGQAAPSTGPSAAPESLPGATEAPVPIDAGVDDSETVGRLRVGLAALGATWEATASCSWARSGGRDAVATVATVDPVDVAGWTVTASIELVPWLADPWLAPPRAASVSFERADASFEYRSEDPLDLAFRVAAGDRSAGILRARVLRAVGQEESPDPAVPPIGERTSATIEWTCQRPRGRPPDAGDSWSDGMAPVVREATARLVADPPIPGLADELPAFCWEGTVEGEARPMLQRVDVVIELPGESARLVVLEGGSVLWRTAADGSGLGEYVADQGIWQRPLGDQPVSLSLGDVVYEPASNSELPIGGLGGPRGFVGRLNVTCGHVVLGSPRPSAAPSDEP